MSTRADRAGPTAPTTMTEPRASSDMHQPPQDRKADPPPRTSRLLTTLGYADGFELQTHHGTRFGCHPREHHVRYATASQS